MKGVVLNFMKLAYDNDTLLANKALILYVLDRIGKPISNTALLKFITNINNMNYFYFQQFLLDLLETKYIISYEKDGNIIYELTSEGKQSLQLIKDLIPGYLKFKVDNSLKENLKQLLSRYSDSILLNSKLKSFLWNNGKNKQNNKAHEIINIELTINKMILLWLT